MKVGVWKVGMSAPDDTSELERLIQAGKVDPGAIVAFIGKTEGNGGASDFTRGFATLAYQLLLARHLGRPVAEIGETVAFVWSGGTEGVLSPHATIFTREPGGDAPDGQPRLALGIAMTRDIRPEEIGTMAQVGEVADPVRRAMADAGIDEPREVHYVQVKGPLLTPGKIADADDRGAALVTRDPNGSKPYARGAMGLGVALGLNEIAADAVSDDIIARDMALFSNVASTSAGGELTKCEVLLFGNSPSASSDFRIGHDVLRDAIDGDGVRRAIANARGRCDGADATAGPSRFSPRRKRRQRACCAAAGRRCFPMPTSTMNVTPARLSAR